MERDDYILFPLAKRHSHIIKLMGKTVREIL